MTQKFFITALGFLIFTGLLQAQEGNTNPPAPRRASIVFIVADGLGYGDLGCYGQRNIKTPNLDRMAEEGARLTSFYAGGADNLLARATFLSGRDAARLQKGGDAGVTLPPEGVTLAEFLKQSGYRTGCIGVWGLAATPPTSKGFDEWAGFLDESDAQSFYPVSISRYDPVTHYDGTMTFSQNEGGQKTKSADELFTTAAMNFCKNNKPDQFNRYRPFFLYLGHPLPRNGKDMKPADAALYEKESWPAAEKSRAALVSHLDASIGKILDRLKELKMESNTLVIVTSDGGPRKEGGVDPKFHRSSGGLRGGSGELYEGGLRVPLLARWLGTIPGGAVNDEPWPAQDVLPTFADVALRPVPETAEGISFLPLLRGFAQTNRHEFLHWEIRGTNIQQAVRMDDWKAVRSQPGKPLELYNLKADAAEKTDVAKKNPDITAKIEAYLKTARAESESAPGAAKSDEKR